MTEEKKQLVETDTTEVMEFVGKDFKVPVKFVLKDLKEEMNLMREMEDAKQNYVECLGLKFTVSCMNNFAV